MANIKFILNGCDISFVAEAPEDITLKQLLKQCDKIKPDWCACGICSADKVYNSDVDTEIKIGYDSIEKLDTPEHEIPCKIKEE
jgi:hypothetical protein